MYPMHVMSAGGLTGEASPSSHQNECLDTVSRRHQCGKLGRLLTTAKRYLCWCRGHSASCALQLRKEKSLVKHVFDACHVGRWANRRDKSLFSTKGKPERKPWNCLEASMWQALLVTRGQLIQQSYWILWCSCKIVRDRKWNPSEMPHVLTLATSTQCSTKFTANCFINNADYWSDTITVFGRIDRPSDGFRGTTLKQTLYGFESWELLMSMIFNRAVPSASTTGIPHTVYKR